MSERIHISDRAGAVTLCGRRRAARCVAAAEAREATCVICRALANDRCPGCGRGYESCRCLEDAEIAMEADDARRNAEWQAHLKARRAGGGA